MNRAKIVGNKLRIPKYNNCPMLALEYIAMLNVVKIEVKNYTDYIQINVIESDTVELGAIGREAIHMQIATYINNNS